MFWTSFWLFSRDSGDSQPANKYVHIYVACWFHHFLVASVTNSSKSSGHLEIVKIPKYFSAMDSDGSIIIIWSFRFYVDICSGF